MFISKCYITSGMLGDDHYIYRLRAACIRQPELNRHQLAALDRELAFARAASSPEAMLQASGHMIGLVRAASLDRAANAFQTARRYDDPWSAAAAAIEFDHAQRGSSHAGLYENIELGHRLAAPLYRRAAENKAAFLRLFLNLLHVHTSNFELENAYAAIHASFATLRESDPAFLPETWMEQPRYHARLPWHKSLLHEWLDPFWEDVPATAPPLPAVPSHLKQPVPWAGHGWPDAEPLHSPPATDTADIFLARQAEWPDRFIAAHWEGTRNLLLAACSPIAQESVASDRDELFSIESARNLLFLSTLLAPLRARANHGWQRTGDSHAGIAKAAATSRALTTLTPEQILATERVRHFLAHNLQPRLANGADGFGALAGEAGFDLLRHAATWLAVAGEIDFSF